MTPSVKLSVNLLKQIQTIKFTHNFRAVSYCHGYIFRSRYKITDYGGYLGLIHTCDQHVFFLLFYLEKKREREREREKPIATEWIDLPSSICLPRFATVSTLFLPFRGAPRTMPWRVQELEPEPQSGASPHPAFSVFLG